MARAFSSVVSIRMKELFLEKGRRQQVQDSKEKIHSLIPPSAPFFPGSWVEGIPLSSFLFYVDSGKLSLKINAHFPLMNYSYQVERQEVDHVKIDLQRNANSKRDLLDSLNKSAVIKLHLT